VSGVAVATGDVKPASKSAGGRMTRPAQHGAVAAANLAVSAHLASSKLRRAPQQRKKPTLALMWAPLIGSPASCTRRMPDAETLGIVSRRYVWCGFLLEQCEGFEFGGSIEGDCLLRVAADII